MIDPLALADMVRRLRALEDRVRGLPSRFAGGSAAEPWEPASLVILGGNVVPPDSLDGIVRTAAVLTGSSFESAPGTFLDPGTRGTAGTVTKSAGVITAVAVATGGSVYKALGSMSTAEKTCTVTGGGGSGAIVEVGGVTSGAVTSLTVVNGGTGYTGTPTVKLPRPTGTPAGLPWPDGVGYGDLFPITGDPSRVLVALDGAGPLQYALIAGQVAAISGTRLVRATSGGGTKTVRVPLWI